MAVKNFAVLQLSGEYFHNLEAPADRRDERVVLTPGNAKGACWSVLKA